MYIASFHMENFGNFTDASAGNLSPGINIFFGANGAGKTTCFDFLRAMLASQNLEQVRPALSSDKAVRGKLEMAAVIAADKSSKCEILFHGPSTRETICSPKEAANNLRDALLALSPDNYKNIYSFGLLELEKFAAISTEKASRMLFGNTFGPGLASPGAAQLKLKSHLDSLYSATQSATPISELMAELETVQQQLAEIESSLASYDRLADDLRVTQTKMVKIRKEKRDLVTSHRQLEKRLASWQLWSEWQSLGKQEEELKSVPETFPADAVRRLELILAARQGCEQQIAARKARIKSLDSQKEQLESDPSLIDLLPRLRQLAEKKASVETALKHIDGLREKSLALTEELHEGLERLGNGWNCERIRATDRSLFAREKLEQMAEELTGAKEAYQAALASLATGNQEVTASEQALATASSALAALPEPESEISAREREDLRSNMGRLQECRRQNQSREKNLENARHALTRALEMARITPILANSQIDLEGTRGIISNLLHSREEGLEISNQIQEHVAQIKVLHERLALLENGADNLKKKIDELLASTRPSGTGAQNSIDNRSRALHSLRSNVSRLETACEKLENINLQLSEKPKRQKSSKIILAWIGLFLALAGCALFAFSHLGFLQEIVLGDMTLPVTLPFTYGMAAIGVILIGIGWPGKHNSRKVQREEMARLLASRETEMLQIADLHKENQQLAEQAGIMNTDPITLDATEVLLEREKEQHIHEERSLKDLATLREEHKLELEKIHQAHILINKEEDAIQICRKQWQDMLDRMRIADSPTPESALTVFTRVEACQIALDNVVNAEKELNELWEDLHRLESSISSMPAVASRLAEAREPSSLEEAVRLVLESCRNADKMWQDRVQAQSALHTVEHELAHAHVRQEEAARKLDEANTRLEKAREDWRRQISGFGISEQADPQTMREALRLMDKCLANENALKTENRTITQYESEIDEMDTRLHEILQTINFPPLLAANGKAALIATLSQLLEKAEENAAIANEQKRLDSLLASQNEDLEAAEAELQMLESREKNLLAQTSAKDREEFLNLAEKYDKKQKIKESRAKLEASLEIAAGSKSLDEFLASFTGNELSDGEAKLESMQREIERLSDQEETLSNESAALSARIKGLNQQDDISLVRQKKAILYANLEQKIQEYTRYAMALKLLDASVRSYEISNQPQIARQASEYFNFLTNDMWKALRVNLETKTVNLINDKDESTSPSRISRSLLELAHFALRLACIHEISKNSDKLPILMDDIFVNLDKAHTEMAVKLLAKIADHGKTGQQMLFFTCHEQLRDIFMANDSQTRLFNIENCMITAA